MIAREHEIGQRSNSCCPQISDTHLYTDFAVAVIKAGKEMQVWTRQQVIEIDGDVAAVQVLRDRGLLHSAKACINASCNGVGGNVVLAKDAKRTNGLKWRCCESGLECSTYQSAFIALTRCN